MDNIIICLNAVLPLFIYISIGAVIRITGMMNSEENKRFNKVIFTFFYPVLMFENISGTELSTLFNPKLIVFAISFIVVSILVISFAIVRIEDNNASRGAMIHAIYRSNFVLMGVSVVQNIFGKSGLPTAAMMTAFVIPCFNFAAVILLEHFRGGKADIKAVAISIIRNPLIIGSLVGIGFSLLHLSVPSVVGNVISSIADATTPMALIMLGVTFDPSVITAKGREIMICVIGRLLIVPMIGLPIAVLMGFRDVEFVTLLIMMASPTAVSSYPMAVAMDSDGEIAGSAVMISTPLSCVTLFIWLLIFKTIGIY